MGGENQSNYCRPGHTGAFCDTCTAGQHKDRLGLCQQCEGAWGQSIAIIAVLLTLGVVLTIWATTIVAKKVARHKKLKEKQIADHLASNALNINPMDSPDQQSAAIRPLGKLGLPAIMLPNLMALLRVFLSTADLKPRTSSSM